MLLRPHAQLPDSLQLMKLHSSSPFALSLGPCPAQLEPGEAPEGALCRELHEELGIGVAPGDLRPLTFASHAYDDFHLIMPVFSAP